MIKYLKRVALICFSHLPSEVKVYTYNLLGANIKKSTYIGIGSCIIPQCSSFKEIEIMEGTTIEDNVIISAKEVKIGKEVEIKDNTRITGETSIIIGDFSYIGENTLINLRRAVKLGKETCVAANTTIYTHGVWLPALDGYPTRFGEVILKDNAWVSANAFLMPGVTIGEKSIVGSGAIVTKSVADNTFVAGNPAKEIRKIDSKKRLETEEKDRITKEMIMEFTNRIDPKANIIEEGETRLEILVSIETKKLLVFPKKEEYLIVYKMEFGDLPLANLTYQERKKDTKLIVISLSFKEGVKELCEKKHISWVNLGERKMNLEQNKGTKLLIKSLKNNGLRFSSR